MKRDTIQTPDTEGSKPVLMLQPSKLTLNSGTATVEAAPPLALARDQRVQPGLLAPQRLGLALAGGAAPLGCAALEVSPRERPRSVLARGGAMLPALHRHGFLDARG